MSSNSSPASSVSQPHGNRVSISPGNALHDISNHHHDSFGYNHSCSPSNRNGNKRNASSLDHSQSPNNKAARQDEAMPLEYPINSTTLSLSLSPDDHSLVDISPISSSAGSSTENLPIIGRHLLNVFDETPLNDLKPDIASHNELEPDTAIESNFIRTLASNLSDDVIIKSCSLLDKFILEMWKLFDDGIIALPNLKHDQLPIRPYNDQIWHRTLVLADTIRDNLDNFYCDVGYRELYYQVDEVYSYLADPMKTMRLDINRLGQLLDIEQRVD